MSPEGLIHIVIVLLILGVVFALLDWMIRTLPLFEPFRQVARMVLIVAAVLVVLVYILLPLLRAV